MQKLSFSNYQSVISDSNNKIIVCLDNKKSGNSILMKLAMEHYEQSYNPSFRFYYAYQNQLPKQNSIFFSEIFPCTYIIINQEIKESVLGLVSLEEFRNIICSLSLNSINMKNILLSKYLCLKYSDEKKLLVSKWTSQSENISNDEIKQEITITSELIAKYKPAFILANEAERKFTFDVDIQSWIANTLATACIVAGLQRYAIIMPNDFIVSLSTEQTVDEARNLPFLLKYFIDETEALKWLGI